MTLTLEKQKLSLRDIINRLSPFPEILREVDRGEEAENLDCLIEEIKNELIKEL